MRRCCFGCWPASAASFDSWLKFGGAECLRSYGCDPASLAGQSERTALAMVKDAIPSEHARFIGGFADTLSFGDYLFVHAGITPWRRSVAANPGRSALDPLAIPRS